ncbi:MULTISPECIES: TIGR02450 family Trp-rich protein [unclassified Neptuniibacter]|uniref:TIGR02450 family Trp-rich protein n=1 Tax=unclassified Neptuniibacter TaxID=2630693 RepID=UPI0026E3A4E5|nr:MULTISPECIES: TIGR02450 family Trp-rich protein [unclassified Neptuniibacter]MDO6514325.1 TIGR02450 family Trp-rich protein [Neptuniibacter sp. 2_MG-2023]MDO6594369.1 TIGR02450 family Trp-rich protein [Neptuniibacter sp. 1_MG-2023]
MNQFNPNKLLLSKWTAVKPVEKRKHFIVTELVKDELEQQVIGCVLEAVINKQQFPMDFNELKDQNRWLQGWI